VIQAGSSLFGDALPFAEARRADEIDVDRVP